MHDYQLTPRACSICGNTQLNRSVHSSELMFGTGEAFDYLHCAACGVLHLLDTPADMGRFYPAKSYYSVHTRGQAVRQALRNWRDQIQESDTPFSSWIRRYVPNLALAAMTAAMPRKSARILDVGCGDGALLRSLALLGYESLTGVDPLLDKASTTSKIHLIKGNLDRVEGQFDLISFHHSLEHIPDQLGTLIQAAKLLTVNGSILIRIPTSDSLAFIAYGPRWVQLDAPRHLFLHSHRSIKHIAEKAGLAVHELRCDSHPMQFWASDMYCNNVPLMAAAAGNYKRRYKRLYRQMADWTNKHGCGDQIVVMLRPL